MGPIVHAAPQGPESTNRDDQAGSRDAIVIYGTAVTLTAVGVLSLTFFQEPLEDFLYGGVYDWALGSVTAGDVVAALLWGVSLYFVSPIQLLLLFLGKIETARPSDWFFNQIGRLSGEDVNNPQYTMPASLQALGILWFGLCGILASYVFHVALGGATWGVSTGLGACVGAGVYEVGRPRRYSQNEAEKLEHQWRDFADFASRRLQYSGQCHESEIINSFKADSPKYRGQDQPSEKTFRNMIKRFEDLSALERPKQRNSARVVDREELLARNVRRGASKRRTFRIDDSRSSS